jgi:tRNA A-37 threonylcarbamoyl transferase component Bud32
MHTPDNPSLDYDGPVSRAATGPIAGPITGAWSGTIPPPEDDDDLVGTVLCNTYVIEAVLGEGGMGRVYQARHTRIQRKAFAIKTLHPELLRRPDVVRRFQLEAEAAAAITNPHVIGVYDVDRTDDGRPFMVAELLDGCELGELLEERRTLPISMAVMIVRQVCDALTAAHACGVIHRDMKPENVFLTGDLSAPHVKVLDFGISRLDDSDSQGLTKTGSIMGTPAYMPPEQARGERVDARADVYAVGALLYRALTGRAPFERDDPSATLLAVLTTEPPRPRMLEPSLPEHLEAVIQRAMAREPEQRFASMIELRAALELYDKSARQERPASRVGLEDEARQVKDARPLFIVSAVACLVALVAGLLTAANGVVHAVRGSGATGAELAVGALIVCAAASTPLALLVRHVGRTAWSNSMRMKELSDGVRLRLLAGVTVYGFGALLATAVDHVLVGRQLWFGWDALLFLLALGAALAIRRPGTAGPAGMLGRPVMAAVIAAAVGVPIFGVALLARDREGALPVVADEGEERGEHVTAHSDTEDDVEPSSVSSAKAKPEAKRRASDEELAAAEKSGGLRELAARYPSDARVLRAFMLERGATGEGLAEAIELAGKLHGLDDKALVDERVAALVKKGVEGTAATRDRALDLMGTAMGQKGPDLLYELTLTPSPSQEKARALLDSEAVRKHASPAVLVAHDLRQAKSCQAKAQLLDRAGKEGDQRSVTILRPLTMGTRSGCGFLKLRACAPPCPGEAGRMSQAINAIQARG